MRIQSESLMTRLAEPGLIGFFAVAVLFAMGGCGRPEADVPIAREKSVPVVDEKMAAAVSPPSGESLYNEHCAVCHMPDGKGVPNFQPGLVDSAIVSGDLARLEIVVRAGSAALSERENEFGTEMPPFGFLTNDEVRAIISFMRRKFVEEAGEG